MAYQNRGDYGRDNRYGGSDYELYASREARTSPYVTGRGLKDRENSIGVTPIDYGQMTETQLREQRDLEDARQDQMLDNIHRGVKNLRNQANGINDEVVLQNRMIDDLSNNVDTTTQLVETQTQKAKAINRRKKKICGLYMIIAMIVVAIIVVIAIPG